MIFVGWELTHGVLPALEEHEPDFGRRNVSLDDLHVLKGDDRVGFAMKKQVRAVECYFAREINRFEYGYEIVQ